MGKKSSWISILKKAFTPKSREKVDNGPKIYEKEKKPQEPRKKRHGEVNSFIPLYREPSSIEKILGDVEKEQQYRAHQVSHQTVQLPKSPIRRHHTSANTAKNVVSDKEETVSSYRKTTGAQYKAKSIIPSKQEITRNGNGKFVSSNSAQISAIMIQAAYRGYMARKSYKAIKGIIRLKDMMEGPRVKRQTTNTMRSMQLLVRIQTQIHARRLQMMENQNAHQHQISWKSSNETFGNLRKWNVTNQLEREGHDEWDDSMMTKEEKEESVKRKAEAVMKRERSLAYAHSHQLLTITPKNAHSALNDARTGGHPLWWNWLEQQISLDYHHAKTPTPPTPRNPSATTTAGFALHRPSSGSKPVKSTFDASTPRFSKPLHTRNSSNRWHSVHARPVVRDDDSLTSCPDFTAPKSASENLAAQAPNYMSPTVSAKAKVRPAATEAGGGEKVGRRRLSFALSQSIGSLRMFSSTKEASPVKVSGGRHRPTTSVGEMSVDSTVSLPAGLLRRPFK